MRSIDEYVDAVVEYLPQDWPGRERVAGDLRAHLEASVEAGASEEEAVARMGEPELVAEQHLETVSPVLASPTRRMAAFVADAALGFDIMVAVAMMFMIAGADPTSAAPISDATLFFVMLIMGTGVLLSLAYFPFLEATSGRTLGKKAFGMRVVRENGSRIGWKEACIRRIPMFFQFIPIDGLFIFFTQKKQRAFDKVAGTIVIRSDDRTGLPWAGIIMVAVEVVIVPTAAILVAAAFRLL